MNRSTCIFYLLLSAVLLCNQSASAQSGDSIFQIDIWYSNGQWDAKLQGIKSAEEFISFRKIGDAFSIAKYYSVQKTTPRGKPVVADTVFLAPGSTTPEKTIQQLVSNLIQDKNNASVKNAKSRVGSITDEQIREVATAFKLDWKFKAAYSDAEDRKTLFKNIKALKFFDRFYKDAAPTYNIDTALTFASKTIGFIITTYSSKDTIQYLGQPLNLWLQPFCKVLDGQRQNVHCVMNTDINTSLSGMLPSNSMIKDILETRLRKYYIKWSLEKEDMWQ